MASRYGDKRQYREGIAIFLLRLFEENLFVSGTPFHHETIFACKFNARLAIINCQRRVGKVSKYLTNSLKK